MFVDVGGGVEYNVGSIDDSCEAEFDVWVKVWVCDVDSNVFRVGCGGVVGCSDE